MFKGFKLKINMNKKSILIVEDDEFNQSILVDYLSDKYDVITAYNGHECLSSVLEHEPDLILLDIMMPKMNGYEVIDIFKHNPKLAKIPIIVVSALASEAEKQIVYDMGVTDYITKPFDEHEILSHIKKYLL